MPAGLIALSLIPVAAGAVRLTDLAGGAEITPDNAHFFASPLPVVTHIFSVTIYCILGAFQFHPGLRRRRPRWHRTAGRILIPAGLVAAASGLWMSQFYQLPAHDGELLYVFQLIFGEAYPSEPGLTTCWVCGCRRQDVRLMFCHAQPLEIRPPDVPRRLRGALSR